MCWAKVAFDLSEVIKIMWGITSSLATDDPVLALPRLPFSMWGLGGGGGESDPERRCRSVLFFQMDFFVFFFFRYKDS